VPWGKRVSLYIWTKSIAAGAFLVSAIGVGLGLVPDNPLLTWMAPMLALVFLAITAYLLVIDLKRPERFYTILLRPQWRSWLTIGAYILTLYGALLGLSFLAAVFGATGFHHVLLWSLLANLFIILVGELWMPHGTRDAARAARLILHGPYSQLFWTIVVGLGHAAPVLLLALIPGVPIGVSFLAGGCALVGLLVFEHLWLIAGQAVPLS
jgi:hypothetical protein